jgi:hypothetical protein
MLGEPALSLPQWPWAITGIPRQSAGFLIYRNTRTWAPSHQGGLLVAVTDKRIGLVRFSVAIRV